MPSPSNETTTRRSAIITPAPTVGNLYFVVTLLRAECWSRDQNVGHVTSVPHHHSEGRVCMVREGCCPTLSLSLSLQHPCIHIFYLGTLLHIHNEQSS